MPYVGKNPTIGNFVKLDTITTSATTTFNLLNGGVAYSPQSANHCIVSLNGVIQSPNTSFTISGSTIVFASALTSSDVIDFILVLGDVLNIGTPSDATVGFSKITSNLITGATAVTAPATDDVLLCYDTSATALRKITFANFGNAPAFEAYLSANTTVTDATWSKMNINTELFDTDNCYDNSTNYRFTPTVAGKYFVYAQAYGFGSTVNTLESANMAIYKNGSLFYSRGDTHTTNYAYSAMPFGGVVVDMNGTTDYVEAYTYIDSTSGTAQLLAGTKATKFGAYRLIGM